MNALFAASGIQSFARDLPMLNIIVLIPVIGAVLVALVGLYDKRDSTARAIGYIASIATFAFTVLLVLAFRRQDGSFQFVSAHQWIPEFGIQWKFGVDGISLFLVVLTGLIFPIAFFGAKVKGDIKSFVAWMLVLESGCLGSFVSLDIFLFFVFFEIVLVPMYFLMAGWGGENRRYAAMKFFLYTLAGSAFLFIGMLALAFITSADTHNKITFDFVQLAQSHSITHTEGRWIFIGFAIAFAVKIPLFPLHTWLADTYAESPVAAVVISSAVMVKLGAYGMIRFGLELFPQAAHDLAPLLLTLALIGMVYGAVIAAVQKDLRRLAAYSSLSHLGFIVLGTFALSTQGLSGAVLQMINHGVTAAAMFLLIGMIYSRRGTTFIADLKGLQGPAPLFAGVMTVVVMSSIGVPGLNGFVGEFLILAGTFVTHRWWAIIGTSVIVLAAIYLLWAYQRVFHGEADEETRKTMFDLTARERLVMAPLVILIVFLGVYPRPVLDRIQPSVEHILSTVHGYNANTPANPVPVDYSTGEGQ